MENPLWKKLQNDPALLKQYNKQSQSGKLLDTNRNGGPIATLNGNFNKSDTVDNPDMENNHFQSENNNFHSTQQTMSPSSSHKKSFTNNLPGKAYSNYHQQNHQHKKPIQQNQQQQHQFLADQQTQQLQQLQQYINFQSSQESQFQISKDFMHQPQNHIENQSTNTPQYTSQLSTNSANSINSSSDKGFYYDPSGAFINSNSKRSSPVKRELGLVEKLVGSYGFVKCLDRDGRLFFHYSSYHVDQQVSNGDMALKIGDLIEFEEGIDKRNNKPVATNITKFQQNNQINQEKAVLQQSLDQLHMFNLNRLFKKNDQKQQASNDANNKQQGVVNNMYNFNNQQNYQSILNELKILNIQNLKGTDVVAIDEDTVKSTSAIQSHNAPNSNGINSNNALMNDNLNNLANILSLNNIKLNNFETQKIQSMSVGKEQMDGTIAIVATKRPITSQFNNRNGNYSSLQLDGRITYQRSGETFYIPYSLSDVLPNSPSSPMTSFNQNPSQLRIGDRVRFFIAQSIGTDINVPAGTFYARRVELIHSQDFNNCGYNLNEPQLPKQLYRGIITTLKESFGKIEREDQFKETFFHFHEYVGQNPNQELKLGLNVEFELQDRYGKEIACNVKMLPAGTVSFDEVSREVFIGRIIQPKINLMQNISLNGFNLNEIKSIGKLIFDNKNKNEGETLTELLFTDLDRLASTKYTLVEGDFVQFRIASDKRKRMHNNNTQMHRQQRATQVTLIEEHSLVENSINTGEYRERGILVKLGTPKEIMPNLEISNLVNQNKLGAIKCIEQNELVYFSVNEVINYARFVTNEENVTSSVKEVQLQIGDSLEFSIIKCQKDQLFKSGIQAIRVVQLPKDTVRFEVISTETYNGYIDREQMPNHNMGDKQYGSIKFEYANGSGLSQNKSVLFALNSDESNLEQKLTSGDKVQFNLSTCVKTKKQVAVNVKSMEAVKEQGIITMLKENYGFIELIPRDCHFKGKPNGIQQSMPRDLFFHFSSVQNASTELDVGDEVEFKINRKTRGEQKNCAESISKLNSGTIKPFSVSSAVYKGRIVQQLRSHSFTNNANIMNYSQEQPQSLVDDAYYGKVLLVSTKKDVSETTYEFGICGLSDKKKCFQLNDVVSFQLGSYQDGVKKAVNLQLQSVSNSQRANDLKKGKIDSMKGHCGFIEYLTGNNGSELKKVFFHISDLSEGSSGKSESSSIQVGDEVEFVLTHNSRSGKYSAIKIKKLTNTSSVQPQHSSSSNTKDSEQTDAAAVAKRPEHLITKLKIGNVCDIHGKKLGLIRQPSKPNGKSFCRVMYERAPGSIEPSESAKQETALQNGETVVLNSETKKAAEEDSKELNISPLSIMDLMIANQ